MSKVIANKLATRDGVVDLEVKHLLVRDSAMESLGEYVQGIELKTIQQYFTKDGIKFTGKAFQLPLVLSGVWETDRVFVETYGEQWDHNKLYNKDIPNAHVASAISFKASNVAEALDQRVIYVDTIADLQALPVSEMVDGQQVIVSDWWGGGNFALANPHKGGGVFVATTNSTNAEHNGGTIIDPSVPHPDSQTGVTHTERLGNYLDGVGATGSTVRYARLPDGSTGIRPEWFGAKADAIIRGAALVSYTDDYAAFKKIIDIIEASQGETGVETGLSCVQLSESGYMIGQTLECSGNIRFLGSSNPKMISSGPTSFLTGMPDMVNGIIRIVGLSGFSYGAYGFECDHVGFRGHSHAGGNRLPCAVYTNATGGPARPFNWTACHAERFDDVIKIERSGTSGTSSTTVYNLNCRNSVFRGNVNAIKSSGLNALGGLVFDGNVSEQGGRIDVDVFGTVEIGNNLLEGQSDAIKIWGANAVVDFKPNYWEANTGYCLDLSIDNNAKTTVQPQHIGGSSGQRFVFNVGTHQGRLTLVGDHSGTVVNRKARIRELDAPELDRLSMYITDEPPEENSTGGVRRISDRLSESATKSLWIDIPDNAKVSRVFTRSTNLINSEYGPMGTATDLSNPQFPFSGDSSYEPGDLLVHCAMIYCDEDSNSFDVQILKSGGFATYYATTSFRRGWNRFFFAFEADESRESMTMQYIGDLTGLYVGTQVQYIVPKKDANGDMTRIGWTMPSVIGS